MRDAIYNTFNLARHPRNQPYTAIVAISSFIFALALSFAFKEHLQFLGQRRIDELTEIVGWVSVNNYIKRMEIVNYIAAMIFVPLFSLLACGFWLVISTLCAVWAKLPQESILRQHAFTYLLLLLALEKGYLPDTLAGTVGIPILLCLVAQGFLLAFHLLAIKRKVTKKPKDDIPTAEIGVSSVLWARENLRFHGIPLASGVCLAVFLLIRGSPEGYNTDSVLGVVVFCGLGNMDTLVGLFGVAKRFDGLPLR